MTSPSISAAMHTHAKPYGETLRCPGGALCLDFCNSGQGLRGSRGVEWLANYGDLLDWLEACGALAAAPARRLRRAAQAAPQDAAKVWAHAIELREALYRLLAASAAGQAPARADLALLEAAHAQTAAFGRLDWQEGRAAWTLVPDVMDVAAALQPITQSAVDLLTSATLARVRRCGNPTCTWLFIDETRNRSRRWCEMASCGNMLKVRRHRARAGAVGAAGE